MIKRDFFISVFIAALMGAAFLFAIFGIYNDDPFKVVCGGGFGIVLLAILSNYGRNLPEI